jgi:hypothetical protein
MPRKPKQEKQQIKIVVNGLPITVILHPPSGAHRSWRAYWHGLPRARSTGQRRYEDAVAVAENMLQNGGNRGQPDGRVMSDEEFEEIQRRHFGRKNEKRAQERAKKSLDNCLDALAAFSEITGLRPIILATPDDCASFQRTALTLPNNWRRRPRQERRPVEHYAEKARDRRRRSGDLDPLDDLPRYSPNNVLRWSRSLQAAFERANRNALKRKCVRGVVGEGKLLTGNPWSQFTWIEGRKRPLRQFDGDELLSLLNYLETQWGGVPVGAAAAKVFLWSACRKLEIVTLRWDALRKVGNEYHFDLNCKADVDKWFRIPEPLYQELVGFRVNSPFVFAAYNEQLRQFHSRNTAWLRSIRADYNPGSFGSWFYRRVKDWSESNAKGAAFVHVFRKTTLQHSRHGEDINRQVASDARVSESVMMTNYVKETDEEMRQRSNRTFRRIIASLSPEVARRYGHVQDARSEMEDRLRSAIESKNWALASDLAARLAQDGRPSDR